MRRVRLRECRAPRATRGGVCAGLQASPTLGPEAASSSFSSSLRDSSFQKKKKRRQKRSEERFATPRVPLSHLPTALKTRLGLILAKAVAMRVMINATGCPAPVSDRASMKTHARISDLIASAIDHDLHTPV